MSKKLAGMNTEVPPWKTVKESIAVISCLLNFTKDGKFESIYIGILTAIVRQLAYHISPRINPGFI